METPARYLLFHGSIVLLIGLLSGLPYGMAITKKESKEKIRAWKLAHGALSLVGTTMISMAAILSSFIISIQTKLTTRTAPDR